MKTRILQLLLLGVISATAQPNTGADPFLHTLNVYISSGTVTNINSNGFVMASYLPVTSASSENFFIDKTDVDGQFTGGSSFHNGYVISVDAPGCPNSQYQPLPCFGVSVRETNIPSSITPPVPATLWYVVAVGTDAGPLFGGFDNAGVPKTGQLYTFPTSPSSLCTKPLIIESTLNPGMFYICGSYIDPNDGIRYMYAMKIDAAGGQVWSKLYDYGTNTEIEPTGMLESPYTAPNAAELVIAGKFYDAASGLNYEGFVAVLDDNSNGTVTSFDTYGTTSSATDDWFSSIGTATSTTPGGAGYILGGYTDFAANGKAWMAKIATNGTLVWSKQLRSQVANSDGDVVGVVERYSSAYTANEYYGLSTSAQGQVIFKLNASGGTFTQIGNTYSEMQYLGPNPYPLPACLSMIENSGPNDGIHFYFSTDNTAPASSAFGRACFNGAMGANGTGCNWQTLVSIPAGNNNNGPNNFTNNLSITVSTGLTQCNNFSFGTPTTVAPSSIPVCGNSSSNPTLPYTGNQSRLGEIAGISKNESDVKLFLYPNPSRSSVKGTITTTQNSQITIEVLNSSGAIVRKLNSDHVKAGEDTFEFSIEDLAAGLYFVSVKVGSNVTTGKIVVE